MNNIKYVKSVVLILICALTMTTSSSYFDKVSAQPAAVQTKAAEVSTTNVSPLSIVANPKAYLNKQVTMKAKFDKFSTLGLDYNYALRSSEDYISFLIKRDDTTYDIPLSEMKLFLKRTEAEKFIDLKSDDEIEIVGTVFSDALGDSWIDVQKLIIIKKAPEKDGVK